MSIHCFYHSADLDGHCSGAIVKYKFPDAIMHPINYGQEFPWDEITSKDRVFMVDFCLQPEILMKNLVEHAGEVNWIDHHKSAIEAVPDSVIKYMLRSLDISKAACELTWEYLFPDKPVPLAVKLLSLYDSWTYRGHELEPMVLPFQMRMWIADFDPQHWKENSSIWKQLLNVEQYKPTWPSYSVIIEDYIYDGKLLLRYDEEQKRKYVQTYGFDTVLAVRYNPENLPLDIKWHKAIAVNLGHTNSKVFDSVWRKECPYCKGKGQVPDKGYASAYSEGEHECSPCKGFGYIEPYDLMITFCRRSDRKWNVSLYSTKPEVDCGSIAKSFGGGGHKGASGFQCEDLPFEY